jgi:hypothetical protein
MSSISIGRIPLKTGAQECAKILRAASPFGLGFRQKIISYLNFRVAITAAVNDANLIPNCTDGFGV